jgi:hypothetical protein
MVDCLFLGMEKIGYSEWVPTGALVKSLFVGFSAYLVVFTLAIYLLVENSIEKVYGLAFGWIFWLFFCFCFGITDASKSKSSTMSSR